MFDYAILRNYCKNQDKNIGGNFDIDKVNIFDEKTLKALKQCITGMTSTEVTTEYAVDENGELKIVKQKVNEKNLPPNTDIIKLVYQHYSEASIDYEKLSDEELEKEKHRLLQQLKQKEKTDANRKIKDKDKV